MAMAYLRSGKKSCVRLWTGKVMHHPLKTSGLFFHNLPVNTEEDQKRLHINCTMHNTFSKSYLHDSQTYIIQIRGWRRTLQTIQPHSHRQPKHTGGSKAEVIFVHKGAWQVVCIWYWEASPRVTESLGSLLDRKTNHSQLFKGYLVFDRFQITLISLHMKSV